MTTLKPRNMFVFFFLLENQLPILPQRECGVHIQFIFPAMPTYCLSSCLAFNRPSKTTNGAALLIFWAWLSCDNQLANWAEPDFLKWTNFGPKIKKPIKNKPPILKAKTMLTVCMSVSACSDCTNLAVRFSRGSLFRGRQLPFGKMSMPKGKISPARLLQTCQRAQARNLHADAIDFFCPASMNVSRWGVVNDSSWPPSCHPPTAGVMSRENKPYSPPSLRWSHEARLSANTLMDCGGAAPTSSAAL